MSTDAPVVAARLKGVEEPQHQRRRPGQRHLLQGNRLKPAAGLGIGHSGGAQDRVDQGTRPGGRPARREIERSHTAPRARRVAQALVHSRDLGFAGRASIKRGAHPADVGVDITEIPGVRHGHNPHTPSLERADKAWIASPVSHHHLRSGSQRRLQVNSTFGQTDREAAQSRVGVISPRGQAHDGLARTERQHKLVGALIQRQHARRTLRAERCTQRHRQGDQSMTSP